MQIAQQPRRFDQHSDGGCVVVCARRRPDRIVMSTDDDNLVLVSPAWKLGHDVRHIFVADRVRLSRNFISDFREFSLNVSGRSGECGKVTERARTDQARQTIDMTSKIIDQRRID